MIKNFGLMFKEIAIYSDWGVSQDGVAHTIQSLQDSLKVSSYRIRKITAQQVAKGTWRKKAALFIVPGGQDLFYLQLLQGKGVEQIRAFVEEGGSYLGICAGAYFAASAIEFEKGEKLEICGERPLKFFRGIAKGPAYGPNRYKACSYQGVEAALTTWQGFPCHLYFNGGCFFTGEDQSTEVLANYTHIEEKPAVILCSVGLGKALLSGVHIEYRCLPSFLQDPYLQRVYPLLKQDEILRRKLFLKILQKLEIESNLILN